MADYNATAILDKIRTEHTEMSTPTDQSLNAGNELETDPPVEDGSVIEVKVDVKTIADLMPMADDVSTGAQALEQRYIGLSYLREDLVSQRGINQTLAAEAINILPNFGGNRPLAHYSRHISQTRYTAALEEIDATILADAITYLETLDRRMQTINALATAFSNTAGDKWPAAREAVPAFAAKMTSAINALAMGGYVWSDQELVDTTLNRLDDYTKPAVKAYLTSNLYSEVGILQSIAQKGPYWSMGQSIPVYMDMFEDHMAVWEDALSFYCQELDCAERVPSVTIPKLGSFNLPDGHSNPPGTLGECYWKSQVEAMSYKKSGGMGTILSTVSNVGDAVAYAATADVSLRMLNLPAAMEKRRGTLSTLRRIVSKTPSDSGVFAAMINDITKVATAMTADYLAYFDFLTAVVGYEQNVIEQVNKMCESALLLIDTIDGELLDRPRAAYTFQVEFLDTWKKVRDDMRKTLEYLY